VANIVSYQCCLLRIDHLPWFGLPACQHPAALVIRDVCEAYHAAVRTGTDRLLVLVSALLTAISTTADSQSSWYCSPALLVLVCCFTSQAETALASCQS